jgi:hypothetical protein
MKRQIILYLGVSLLIFIGGCLKEAPPPTTTPPTTQPPPLITKDMIESRFKQLKVEFDSKLAQGYDLTEAIELGKQGVEYYNKGDYVKANQYLEKTKEAMVRAIILEKPEPQCPLCPLPSEWSSCENNKQSRTDYKCDSTTDYKCKAYAEENVCEIPPITPPPEVPMEYRAWYNEKNTWLDQHIEKWKPSDYKPMKFTGLLLTASGNVFYRFDLDTDLQFLDMLEETGSNVIKIYVDEMEAYNPSELQRYDEIVNEIKKDGKELAIDFYGCGGTKLDNFEDYKTFVADSMSEWTQRYNPDYIAPIVESGKPGCVGLQYKSITLEQWHSLAEDSCNAVKDIDTNTKCVVIGHKDDLEILKNVIDIDSVDVIGFNIYGTEGTYDEYNGYLGNGDVVGRAIDYVNTNSNKDTWIGETWLTLQTKLPETFDKPWRAPLDAKWMTAMTYYAQKHDMDGVVPYFSLKFVSYFPEGGATEDAKQAIDEGKRTQIFYTYQNVIQEVGTGAS